MSAETESAIAIHASLRSISAGIRRSASGTIATASAATMTYQRCCTAAVFQTGYSSKKRTTHGFALNGTTFARSSKLKNTKSRNVVTVESGSSAMAAIAAAEASAAKTHRQRR